MIRSALLELYTAETDVQEDFTITNPSNDMLTERVNESQCVVYTHLLTASLNIFVS